MLHDRWRSITRCAALALLPWLCLATVGPGCSPAGQPSSGTARIPDRLKKMRALRGSGDPTWQGGPSSSRVRQVSGRR